MFFFMVLCVKLATALSEQRENLSESAPTARILAPTKDNRTDLMSLIKVVRPGADGPYYDGEATFEEESGNSSQLVAAAISKAGAMRVAELRIRLRSGQEGPAALIVEDDPDVMRTTDIYVAYLMRTPLLPVDFWLMKMNASGVSGVLAQSTTVASHMFRGILVEKKKTPQTKQSIGGGEQRVASFFALLKATRLLPPGAAIVMFTASRVEDEDLAQLAIREIQAKQIRVFIIWLGIQQDDTLLREVATLSQGAFLNGKTEDRSSHIEYVGVHDASPQPVVVHLRGVRGAQRVRVPIEGGAASVHVSLSDGVRKARFYSPQGYGFDLLNGTDVRHAAPGGGSYVVRTATTFECELALSSSSAGGVWWLETAPALAQRPYDIVVSVRHALAVERDHQPSTTPSSEQGERHSMRLRLVGANGDVAIDNVTLTAANGTPLPNNVHLLSTPNETETITLHNLPQEPLYIQLQGKTDTNGGDVFQRVVYYNPLHRVVELTRVELAEGSELRQLPGRTAHLLYTVTNHRDNVVFMRFLATDERAHLRRLSPLWAWLNPHQTLVVTLQMLPQAATTNTVTFSASTGSDRTDKKALTTSTAAQLADYEAPHMWHTFTSNCQEAVLSRCEEHSWQLEVTAQDSQSGLLLLRTSIEGLYFPHGYTSGTTEEVRGVLTGSCCQSSIVLTAIDASSNVRSYEANPYWTALGSASIAAIVISILLLLLIVALIVYCCVWGKCKRTKDSHDLPSAVRYRGPENSAATSRY